MITIHEKILVIERMVEELRPARNFPGTCEHADLLVLRAVASDLRARRGNEPGIAEHQLERRMRAAINGKTSLGYPAGAMIGLAQELIGRWPVVKQALERFGALQEADR